MYLSKYQFVMRLYFKYFIVLIFISSLSGCASYYAINQEFNKNFEKGNIKEAEQVLLDNQKAERSKTRFLYYTNRGVVAHLLGKYQESNTWLEKAYIFHEDHQVNYLNHAGSYFLNPNLIVYPGEDHEHLLLLYYKVLNYLKLGENEAALVECRRLNERLIQLSDKYKSENRYKRDAFIHTLMGIIYQANHDYNNAFIAYRNSVEIYKNDYSKLFGVNIPEQLKQDLVNTAYLAGFLEEGDQYAKEFGITKNTTPSQGGDMVFLWHNGLSPVKQEWSINFVASPDGTGRVVFVNEEMGLNFPFFFDNNSDENNLDITDITGTRVAFPKYVERPPFFVNGNLNVNGEKYPLSLAEDVNKIAFKTLNERMIKELGKGLLRLAIKKLVEQQVRKEDKTAGFLVGMVNFFSEKADTRNWQSLPHSIFYTRVPLKEGTNQVVLEANGYHGTKEYSFEYIGEKGKTQFQSFQTLESKVGF